MAGRRSAGSRRWKALTTADAVAWYKKWYTPNNATLIVVGDVKPEEVKALAEKYYGPIPSHPVPERIRPQIRTAGRRNEPRVTLRDGNIHQPQFARIYVAPNYSAKTRKQALALEVFDEIFGTGTTSRLYQTLAVKLKVATGASSSTMTIRRSIRSPTTCIGHARRRAGISRRSRKAYRCRSSRTLLKGGVTDAEVADAKARLGGAGHPGARQPETARPIRSARRCPPARRSTTCRELARLYRRGNHCTTLMPPCAKCSIPGRRRRQWLASAGWRAPRRRWMQLRPRTP